MTEGNLIYVNGRLYQLRLNHTDSKGILHDEYYKDVTSEVAKDIEATLFSNAQQQPIQAVKDIDEWEYFRREAAMRAMQGFIISDSYATTEIGDNLNYYRKKISKENMAELAVQYADALIEELKKKE